MSLKLTALLLTVCFNAAAQNCKELVHPEKKIVFEEDNSPTPLANYAQQGINHYTEKIAELKNKSYPTKTVYAGYEVKIQGRESFYSGGMDTAIIRPIRDNGKLYITCEHTTFQGCQITPSRSYYVLTLADGTTYKYEEPYYTEHVVDDMFILLKGSVNTMDYRTGKKGTAAGDSVLLKKLMSIPVQSIRPYHAADLNAYSGKNTPQKSLEYKPGDVYRFSKKDAITFMESLRCLAK